MEALSPTTYSGWPPGVTTAAFRHCPRSLRDDAIQEAWLAVADGRNPDSAVRALVRHEAKHHASRARLELCSRMQIRMFF